ncbi:hypothetical protein MG296_08815 [Flavobacteriaceae bacterium TK19130]|nr:hypothetical protein [Thermobacterium salinum]
MKNDDINNLFKDLEGQFDLAETPDGHTKRFMKKLTATSASSENQQVQIPSTKTINMWKPLAIVASIAACFAIVFSVWNRTPKTQGLAAVSPEMEKTETFFTATIAQELRTLKTLENPQTKALVDDALEQITILESEYQKLEGDLAESGYDKRVIYAMINNFQNRIDVLQTVIETISELETLKNMTNETTI